MQLQRILNASLKNSVILQLNQITLRSSTFRRGATQARDSAGHRNPWLLPHSALAESAPFSPHKKVQRSAALISSHVPFSPLSMSHTFSAYTLSPHPLWSSCPIHIPRCVCLYLKHCLCFLLFLSFFHLVIYWS